MSISSSIYAGMANEKRKEWVKKLSSAINDTILINDNYIDVEVLKKVLIEIKEYRFTE